MITGCFNMKKYHIGYVQGTFDMFHIGHLNLLQRAKEHCDILYVGVVSDDYSKAMKGIKPYIICGERVAIVSAINVVDKAFVINSTDRPVIEFWEKHKFDCFFSGDDHKNGEFLQELRDNGIDYMFFPYTRHISSTKVKEQMRRRILYGWAEDYPFEKLPKTIALYGAGTFGKALYEKIYQNTRIEISHWVDKKANELNGDGWPVELPNKLFLYDYEKVVIAVKRKKLAISIRDELIAMGIHLEKIMWFDLYDR